MNSAGCFLIGERGWLGLVVVVHDDALELLAKIQFILGVQRSVKHTDNVIA